MTVLICHLFSPSPLPDFLPGAASSFAMKSHRFPGHFKEARLTQLCGGLHFQLEFLPRLALSPQPGYNSGFGKQSRKLGCKRGRQGKEKSRAGMVLTLLITYWVTTDAEYNSALSCAEGTETFIHWFSFL